MSHPPLSRSECLRCLALDDTAEAPAIRRAYRRLALQHHPDRNEGSEESSRRFMELVAAYKELMRQESERVKAKAKPPIVSPAEMAIAHGLTPVELLPPSAGFKRRQPWSERGGLMLTVIICLGLALAAIVTDDAPSRDGEWQFTSASDDTSEESGFGDEPFLCCCCCLPLGLLLLVVLGRHE